MNAATLINQTSGKVEYYTPAAIVEAARRTMGGIDLDPASCEFANRTVRAARFYDAHDNGLIQDWFGHIWLNHPFGRHSNPLWISKLIDSYCRRTIDQACCITFACTSETWFQPLFAFPMCFLSPRTNYLDAHGRTARGVTKGSVVTYLGHHADRFAVEFGGLGAVMFPAEVW